jgi:hypothetical protein
LFRIKLLLRTPLFQAMSSYYADIASSGNVDIASSGNVEEPRTASVEKPAAGSADIASSGNVEEPRTASIEKRGAPSDDKASVEEPGAASVETLGAKHKVSEIIALYGDEGEVHEPVGENAIVPVLLSQEMLQQVRAETTHQVRNSMHRAMRDALQAVSNGYPDALPPDWAKLPWRQYIAQHPQAADLVGAGIVDISHVYIEGTADANRMCRPRCDFALAHADGGHVRIHPGTHPRNDAKPFFVPSSVLQSPAQQWATLAVGEAFTFQSAEKVPPIDRMGARRALQYLREAGVGELAKDQEAPFKWWLWLATIAHSQPQVVRPGAVSAAVEDVQPELVLVTVRQSDGSAQSIHLLAPHDGRPKVFVSLAP